MKGLIGYTGFIGSNLQEKQNFEYLYNSKNISKISKKKFNILVCAGARGSMIHANRNPDLDKINIDNLINHLLQSDSEKIILISTIGVFDDFGEANDECSTKFEKCIGYGANRRYLEESLQNKFSNLHIIRLPSVFGKGLKKNFIFDILNQAPSFFSKEKFSQLQDEFSSHMRNLLDFYFYDKKKELFFLNRKLLNSSGKKNLLENCLNECRSSSIFFHSSESTYQFYNLKNLWRDISNVIMHNIPVIHLVNEPLKTKDIYRKLLSSEMPKTNAKLHHENMITKFSDIWDSRLPFIETKEKILNELNDFYQITK